MATNVKLQDLIALRKQGWSSQRIAALYQLPLNAVDHALIEAKEYRSKYKDPVAENEHSKICRLYKEGMTSEAIATEMNVTKAVVRNTLHYNGCLKHKSIDMPSRAPKDGLCD